ncbi:MAG: hypothetical protein P8178_07980 [Candidatus Thiodiazotropha sp.]
MTKQRNCLLLATLVFTLPLHAELKQPDCAALEQWSQGIDAKEQADIAPKIQYPPRLQDERLVPLFGKPILSWSKAEFREASLLLNACRKAAAKRRDKAASGDLNMARSLVQRAAGPARYYQRAQGQVAESVDQLTAQAPSSDLDKALGLAIETLKQTDVRAGIRGLPYDKQRPLQNIVASAPYLPYAEAGRIEKRLSEARDKIDADLQAQARQSEARAEAARIKAEADAKAAREAALAEQQQAREEVKAARENIAKAANNNYGLMMLEGMADMPALEKVSPQEKQAFLNDLYARHREVSAAVKAAQTQEAQAKAEKMLTQLRQMDAHELKDIGQLYAFRESMHNEMRQRGDTRTAQAFEDGFNAYFAQVLDALKPKFGEALAAIPVTVAGMQQLDRVVADLTGIRRQTPKLNTYYAMVDTHRQSMRTALRHKACEQVWEGLDISRDDAETPVWGAGKATTLGALVCAIVEQGSKIHAYEDAGLISDVHTLKLTDRSDGYVTLKLHPGEVAPGQTMLLGFEISDANSTRALSVKQWEAYAGAILEGESMACSRLANKPRSELSVAESMTLMNCMMSQMAPPQ